MNAGATALDGESLDALVWRELAQGAGTLEAILDANPGLSAIGAALPQGTFVALPASSPSAATVDLVQLWD